SRPGLGSAPISTVCIAHRAVAPPPGARSQARRSRLEAIVPGAGQVRARLDQDGINTRGTGVARSRDWRPTMESTLAHARTRRDRIELHLYAHASARQHHEIGAFVRFCVFRIERELGPRARWIVNIQPASGGFQSTVTVQDGWFTLEATGRGLDGSLAAW